MPASEDYSGRVPPPLPGAFDFLGPTFDPKAAYSAPASLKEAKGYQDVFNFLRKGTNDFSNSYYDELNRIEIPDYYVPGTDTYLRYNPGDGRIIASTFVQGEKSPTGEKGWIDQTMYPSGQGSTDFRRKTSTWEKLQGAAGFALPFLAAAVGIPALLGNLGAAGAGAAGAGAAGAAGGSGIAGLAAMGIDPVALAAFGGDVASTIGAGAAGAGAAGLGIADLASMAAQVDPQALAAYGGDVASNIGGLALPSSAELQALVGQAGSEIATGGVSGGISGGVIPGSAGVTGGAIADLAAMGIDPQALAAYGGDVASNIGAGSSGLSLSTVARAANTARKLLSNEEEKSKGIDPKLASALGSLVGMGIGGSDDSTAAIPKYSFTRKALPIDTTRRPGSAAQRYFEDSYTRLAAGGGISGLKPNEYKAGGRYLAGPGDGMSDNIKANIDGVQEARLADGEFVIPADVVSHIGNGSSNAGAKKLHKMMARIRKARTGNPKQGKQIKAEKFLPA